MGSCWPIYRTQTTQGGRGSKGSVTDYVEDNLGYFITGKDPSETRWEHRGAKREGICVCVFVCLKKDGPKPGIT